VRSSDCVGLHRLTCGCVCYCCRWRGVTLCGRRLCALSWRGLMLQGAGLPAANTARFCPSATMAANLGSPCSDFNSSSDSMFTCSLEGGKPFSTALRRTARASPGL
jgi:hypothetical protein